MINLKNIDERMQKLVKRQEKIKSILNGLGVETDQQKECLQKKFYLEKNSLKELKIACVMDRFTLDSYQPECCLLEVTPENWESEITSFKPDLLFIESAWQGKNGLWYKKIANGSKEFFEMASFCQESDIPIIFWNKEDPIYTDVFMPIARMADVVFTTDIDCISKYKQILHHDQVYHLHFAAQPLLHNPIEKYTRKNKFCFAGAYYHRYPKRAEVFDKFSKVFLEREGLDIYDRNYQNALPEHAFPEFYNPYILGKLDPNEIDIAYKGYYYGINMNSVSQSQSMFARRVFEMLASNTITVGNYSRGVKNYFGDLTICTDDDQELLRLLTKFCSDETDLRKYRLSGLRKVLSEHLYEDRLDYIVQKVFGKSIKQKLPPIVVITDAKDEALNRIVQMFSAQTYSDKILYVIGTSGESLTGVKFLSCEEAKSLPLDQLCDKDAFITYFHPDDYYGKNYLTDLVYTLRYHKSIGIGKSCYYYKCSDAFKKTSGLVYQNVSKLAIRRSIFKISFEYFNNIFVPDFISMEEIEAPELFAVDEFNYCETLTAVNCREVDDIAITDQGIALDCIEEAAEAIYIDTYGNEGSILSAASLYKWIKNHSVSDIDIRLNKNELIIQSSLPADKNTYIYFDKVIPLADLYLDKNTLNIIFMGNGSMEVLGVILFLDKNSSKISPAFPKMSTLCSAEVPANTEYVKLGIRVRGTGIFKLRSINAGISNNDFCSPTFLSRSNVLILSNQYPSYDNLYRNMFINKRMTAYNQDGFTFDAMRMNIYSKDNYSEFEGINIVEGQSARLAVILSSGKINTVCVHFLDRQMWEVLKQFPQIRILVWVHGSEIQPWWRREYNYVNTADLEKAKKESEVRMAFWKEIFSEISDYNIHFIFVSNYFANEIFEDNKIILPKDRYRIIHNCIDTDLFNYTEKSPEQRKKILSIRPYANRKYANDLTVQAILELSKRPYFNELEFTLIGNGELFDETLKPLKKFKNVNMYKKFLRQEEIAAMHKQYGLFLTPTRMDAQGVSRDEAMSSGLVPITNAVTAIPEFVDDTCGILAPGEDYMEMANGIEKLYYNAELFQLMSKNAAHRVRGQSSWEQTIKKEEALIVQDS